MAINSEQKAALLDVVELIRDARDDGYRAGLLRAAEIAEKHTALGGFPYTAASNVVGANIAAAILHEADNQPTERPREVAARTIARAAENRRRAEKEK